jgi:membrane fusion protein, multidrug efflux system
MNKVDIGRIPFFGLLVFFLCFFNSCNKSGKQEAPNQATSCEATTLIPQDVTVNAAYPATLEGRQNVEIRSKVDGFVEAIYVDEGASVKKGQLLFRISSPQYEEAVRNTAAAISSAQAAVSTAQLEVEKVKPLVEKDIISKYELESAQLTLQSKKAALAQAKAELANAKANLNYTRITSPVDGTIGLIPNKIGSLVSSTSTEPLTTVSDTREVYAYFSMNEKQLLEFYRMNPGKTQKDKLKNLPKVTLQLSDGSDYAENGTVEMVSGLIDTETGSATFRAIFSNPAGLIRSGGSATLKIPKHLKSVLIIPQDATYELQNKRFAFVVKSDNAVTSTTVETTPTDDGKYFIVTKGLNAGDKVVLEGVSTLKEGAKIQPKLVANSIQ